MTKTFNCASCSAPLEFAGTTIQKCEHCGSTVVAPPDMFFGASQNPFGDFSSLTGKALKIAEIDQLIHDGKKIEAIKVFRETFGTGLKEAKDAVEAMERGESIDISGMQVRSARKANQQNLEAIKKIGVTVGGSILVTILISTVVIGGVIAAILYFTLGRVERSISSTNGNTSASRSEKAPDASELMTLGGEGNGPGKFKDNRHVAVDGQGRIYSSDYSPLRIQVFDADGKFINQWKTESGTNLYDLAADRAGNLFLANDKGLFKYEGETGKLLATAEKIYPRAMALSWDGKVVVASGKSISIFDGSLKLVNEIKDAAEKASSTFGFESIAVDGDGVIYAVDRKDVCKFSLDGKFLDRFAVEINSPNAIAIDPKGRIFLSDTNSIKAFDANGKSIRSFGTKQAFGMAFNQAGEIFVASRPYVIKFGLAF